MFRTLLYILLFISSLASASDTRYKYLYLEAVRQQDMRHHAAALELFRQCYHLDPSRSEGMYSLGLAYLSLKQDSLGTALVSQAHAMEPDNTEYAETLARVYLMKDSIARAAEVYEQLVAALPDRSDYNEMLLRIYNSQRDYPAMLRTLNRLETQEGSSENITLTKMQVYSYMDDQQGAWRELKSLVDAHPYDMNLKVMMGNWLQANSRKDEALATFQEALATEPDNAQAQMSLMDYYRANGETDKADTLLYQMLINPRTEAETRVTLLSDWVRAGEQSGADSLHVMSLLNKVLSLPQQTSEVEEIKIAYMMLKQAPKDSIMAGWQRVLDITPEHVSARLSLIQLMWQDSITDEVVRECRKAVEYAPDEPGLYYYLGMAEYITEHHDDALSSLRRGASCISSETNKDLAADIFSLQAEIHQRKGNMEQAYAAWDSSFVYKPDNYMALNNYAYFLSLDNRDLKRAEKMSHRTITAEANNPTFLDTYAWILYKQQRYEEARIYIEQALEWEAKEIAQRDSIIASSIAMDTITVDSINTDSKLLTPHSSLLTETDSLLTENGDILDHAGDIYYKLRRPADARRCWERVLLTDFEDKATIRKKLKKIKSK